MGEKGAGEYPGTAEIFKSPIILGTHKAIYELQIWHVYSQGLSQQKPFKNFGEKRALAHPVTAEIFSVPPIISGMGKATKFKFGRYIHRVHANQRHLRIWEKRERWHIQGLPKFLSTPYYPSNA